MVLNLKDKLVNISRILCYYGIIMFIMFMLSGLLLILNDIMMNTILLALYIWADITIFNNEFVSVTEILLAKVINIVILILLFVIKAHPYKWRPEGIGIFFPLVISGVIILIYWGFNKYEDSRNRVIAVVMFGFAVLLYSYVGLRADYNNYIRKNIYKLGMEVKKIDEMFENDVELEKIISTVRINIDFNLLANLNEHYIKGFTNSFQRSSILSPIGAADIYNVGNEDREFLEIINKRFKSNIWRLYDYGEMKVTPSKLRKFFEYQQRYPWAYPRGGEPGLQGVEPGLHNLIFEWSKENDQVSRELLLFSLGYVDFNKLEEVEKKRKRIDLSRMIINFDKYDISIMWSVFYGYQNAHGESKLEIEKGLQSLYSKDKYREMMIQIAKDDVNVKELLDKFERINID
ncbi:hypothetical protein [Oceanirhabdus sp. W0125-5]|uniref:hypothetical protein n=1 Tax=Oceanirhabdus sp. W0125-5 TaxID=2999116 RepID=UPI0022F2E9C4|nr:hypothetical protein [Oceanirhabdus sp. W0125-5]WBW95900.1 hypothetical protein OW730_19740 [Oceanirhabdus sp. W0125-5]